MKTLQMLVVCGLVTVFAGSLSAGQTKQEPFDRAAAEENLLVGVVSNNEGLRLSAASILAEVGSEHSVIPLLAMLHNGNEAERVVAALALSKIGDGRGLWAVIRASQFDPSDKVRRYAAWFYNEYAVPKPDFTPDFKSVIASPLPYPEGDELTEGTF